MIRFLRQNGAIELLGVAKPAAAMQRHRGVKGLCGTDGAMPWACRPVGRSIGHAQPFPVTVAIALWTLIVSPPRQRYVK
jgi:hypothetical protein